MPSDDQSDIDQSPILPLPSLVPNQEEHIERIVNNRGLRTFLIVDHTANLRKNSKISAIWHHGGERRRLDDNSMTRYWRCHHCIGSATVLKIDGNGGQTTTTRVQIEAQLVTALLGDAGAVEEDVD